jgi:AbrB family looped-hinge helix DNA binding protein
MAVARQANVQYFPTVGERAMASEVSYLSVDQKGRATLPEKVRASLGLRPGDFVLLEKTERGTYELVPAALVPRDQLWFHHPEMQRRIRKAEADLAEGRTRVTRTVGETQTLLDSFKGRRRRQRR